MHLFHYLFLTIRSFLQVSISITSLLNLSCHIGFFLFCDPVALAVSTFYSFYCWFYFLFFLLSKFLQTSLNYFPFLFCLFYLLSLRYCKLLDKISRPHLPRVLGDHYSVNISCLDNDRKFILPSWSSVLIQWYVMPASPLHDQSAYYSSIWNASYPTVCIAPHSLPFRCLVRFYFLHKAFLNLQTHFFTIAFFIIVLE